ncbi:unnamed protein product [Lactuca saligna]|uniref:Uncharacterized protein n=1 Tax=Lactuca saligna TaxID=75948 RepID=A0AA35UUY2_LACSI|nr:unnamed protein product [Lactuca saligna]
MARAFQNLYVSTLNSQASLLSFGMILTILSLPRTANVAWNMGEWDQMTEYVSKLDDGDETKLMVLGNINAIGDCANNETFFRVVLLVRKGKVILESGFLHF